MSSSGLGVKVALAVACIASTVIAIDIAQAASVPKDAAPPWAEQHDEAVRLARRGDTAAALVILERLQCDHLDDLSVARDRLVISGWAGEDSAVIRLYQGLPPVPQPDTVIEAVGRAYRNLHQPTEALVVYRQGSRQSPANAALVAGEIRSLVDLGELEPAAARAESALRERGERIEILLAAGAAAEARDQPVEAVHLYDRALRIDPASRDARHDRILAIERMGAPQVAHELADANPGLLTPAEYRRIEASEAAALVRWGVLDPPSEAELFAATDRAIAALDALIARWSALGTEAHDDVLRARFDRIIALRDRVRMADVLAEYGDLRSSSVELPGYVLEAVADAYLYKRQPEAARDLYRRVLEAEPSSLNARVGLFYAYVEIDDFRAAYRQIDTLDAELSRWLYLKGLKTPIPNPGKSTADLTAASARLYADDLAEAHRRFAAIAQAAPNNTHYVAGLANIYSARGWPRRAAEEYEIGRAQKRQDVELEVGQARNDLALRDYRAAEAETSDLKARFPENLEVQRADRLWQVHNMAELRITAEQAFRSATNVQGGSGISIGTQLYSPPIAYDWRVFAGELYAHEEMPGSEGQLVLNRPNAGVEYRHRDLTASLEGTFSTYRQQDPIRGSIGQEKLGGRAAATWSIDDHWQLGGAGELFARDTPLRALRSGVTADAGTANLAYRVSESRAFRLDGGVMTFSDGNVRTAVAGTYTERLLTEPHFSIDGIAGLAGSENSADNNRRYFNPRQDVLASFGAAINQSLYRRYEFIYDHRLVVTPGVYWEKGFGTAGVVNVRYEHRLRVDDVFDAALGLGFGRQPYDGQNENTVLILLNLTARF